MRTSSLLCAAALTAASLAGCRGCESDRPPVHLIRNMDTQEKGKAYRKDWSGVFPDGRQWRLPVDGTVAVGHLNDDDLLYEGLSDPLDGGALEPAKLFPESLKVDGKCPDSLADRGAGRYQVFCAPCHGKLGDGKGPVAGLSADGGPRLTVPPPSFTDERRKGLLAGQLYAAIKHGVNNGNMASYAAQIPTEDRWAIIAHIRRDIQKQDCESGEAPTVVAVGPNATAETGAALYKSKGCNACHSIDGSRLVGPSFKGLWGKLEPTSAGDVKVDDAYFKESILQPMAKTVNGYPPAMPPQVLTDIEIQSLALYVQTLK
ncbi:MAG: c-type cytochrome [Myxococcales bacterium]|nr:c-type cytochrome [Myxococcales bacterium]